MPIVQTNIEQELTNVTIKVHKYRTIYNIYNRAIMIVQEIQLNYRSYCFTSNPKIRRCIRGPKRGTKANHNLFRYFGNPA